MLICLLLQKPKENPQNNGTEMEENPLEFPVPNLIELENRVFTESWSIPYKKEESLGKCLLAATRLAEEGKVLIIQREHVYLWIPLIITKC